MKKTSITLFLAAISVAAASANDLKLKFDRPADFFEETFVIGNGTQGGIIYGNPDRERISLNDITLWSGEPDTVAYTPGAFRHLPEIREALDNGDYAKAEQLQHKIQGHNSQYYQPLGNIFIDFHDKSEVSGYHRELDLNNALATVSYRKGDNEILTEYLASAPDSLIAVRITAEKPIGMTLSFESLLNHTATSGANRITADGYAAYGYILEYENGNRNEIMQLDPMKGTHFRTDINAFSNSGKITAAGGKLNVENATDLTIYVTIATNFSGSDVNPANSGRDYKGIADARADRAAKKSFEDIARAQRQDYTTLFSRASVDLGESPKHLQDMPTNLRLKAYTDNHNYDPDLEELYFQYGRYLLISCSRTPEVPANLQGLWNEYPFAPWRANYTVNINLEENYWPAEVTNLGEMHHSLLSFIKTPVDRHHHSPRILRCRPRMVCRTQHRHMGYDMPGGIRRR